MKGAVLMVLSLVAVALGGLALVSTLSKPSLDSIILARDLAISATAVATGIVAPLLHRKFTEDSEEKDSNN
ncbi:hypothetical protein Pogu_2163 [Pyrobaculum oguniense TE7]|uniref:Uncharacterized protein n=1 Tax=Pyrobaculum oguniense (strain DSM 13380 / JCM 10595 / TE7) TaxID=698757 RepID=H6QBB4_PYROT|nr:hypothetical protein Pogu_2163 [Pyrobaculum oguniense TE7]